MHTSPRGPGLDSEMEGGLWAPDQVQLPAASHLTRGILFGIKQADALKAVRTVLIILGA